MKSKYRVTLPIDTGDGAVLLPGSIVELDQEKAKQFQHALIAQPATEEK